jgi:hypothetical protein
MIGRLTPNCNDLDSPAATCKYGGPPLRGLRRLSSFAAAGGAPMGAALDDFIDRALVENAASADWSGAARRLSPPPRASPAAIPEFEELGLYDEALR